MIRVKIEMCPHGDESPEAVREIGRMYIANVGGSTTRGDYNVAVCRRGSSAVPAPVHPDGPSPTRSGSVKGYPRLAYNVWRLIARALVSCFPEERGSKADPITSTCSDDDALELVRELHPLKTWAHALSFPSPQHEHDALLAVGREAWLRGARPRGF